MDPSSAQHQEMGTNSLENMLVCSKSQQERKPRPQPEQALKCPRCDSTNTKFCYYNNYSLSQPRYFCKSCRRYWTKGGTLRNVPVGGGCRKNKRSSSSSSSSTSSASSKRVQDHQPLMMSNNPMMSTFQALSSYDCNDLSLAFARLQKQPNGQLGFDHDHHESSILGNPINNAQYHDILGNQFFESTPIRSTNFFETPTNGFHNLYYGFGNGNNMGEVESSGGNGGEMMIPYEDVSGGGATTTAVTVTTVKQEHCNGREVDQSNNRVLWGFPWQMNGGDGNIMGGDVDSTGRESWNNGFTPSWHGLLNSTPLI